MTRITICGNQDTKTMKKSRVLTAVGASTVLAASAGHAQCTNSFSRFYVDAGLGAAFQQDAGIRNSPFGNSGNVQFDAGPRGDLHFGYYLTRSFAAEFQTGVIWNTISNFQTPNGDNKPATLGYSADLYEVPFLANLVYRPLHGAIQPYIGVGCGGAAGDFVASNVPLFEPHFNAVDFTFAYQAELGINFAVSRSMKLGVAYELLGTTDHNWSDNGYSLKIDGTLTHAVVASFIWEF